ncbi:hypothetical protein AB833_14600 [Chromatiales bacterium (ex Bugula neritina AB1)]|nr:hypothetical protein AB833_14600 [Chromatiales bacterium (ex Bugula neritina AB1)]
MPASILALFLALVVGSASAQSGTAPGSDPGMPAWFINQQEFAFARLMYNGIDLDGWGPRWLVDWPEAEVHLLAGLKRLTRIDVNPEGALVQLGDDALFDYPWLYAVEVGSLSLNNYEASRLREYLLRGGFLMVDDFHGPFQWDNFAYAMRQVFPQRKIEELGISDEIFHVLYDMDNRTQIPGIRPWREGRTWERGGNIPHWRGIRDDNGRVMVAINFNMDLGDAWEHADWPEYPEPYSAMAYRIAINYVVYSMTH